MSEAPTDRAAWNVARIEAQAPDGKSLTAARELLNRDAFPQVEPTADGRGWWAVCRGSTDLYRVTVRTGEYGFECDCTCPSRKHPCKHALALLLYLAERPELRTAGASATRAPTDFEGLLRAVFANPTDDTPRLIFADYLDENDQPDRAALIRTQCEWNRAAGTEAPAGERAATEKRLLDRLVPEFDLPDEFVVRVVRGFARIEVTTLRFRQVATRAARIATLFRNGWVETVGFEAPHYREIGPWSAEDCALLRQAGCLDFTGVRQTDTQLVQLATDLLPGAEGCRLARVAVHPLDAELYAAFVSGAQPANRHEPAETGEAADERALAVTAAQLGLLIRAGQLDRVRVLNLAGGAVGDGGIAALAADDGFRFTSLSLPADMGTDGVAALAGAAWFPALTRLRIVGGPFRADAVAALSRGAPTRLTELELHRLGIGDDGGAELAASRRFPALQTLELPDNLLTETGAAGLLATEHFPALREIDLANNPIPPERWPELVLSARDRPHLDVYFFPAGWRGSEREPVTRTISGEDVRLCITRDSGAALDELARCPALARVTGLVLRNRTIPADTAAALAAALAGGRLRDLDLSGCVLDDNPLPHILGFCANPHLAVLSLARMGLKYPIIARLALSPAVSHLRVLDLSDNPIGAGGLDAVLGSPHLRGLERFVFRGTMGLSQRERAHFQKQFGKRAEF